MTMCLQAATWAAAGLRVNLASRDAEKAAGIVSQILSATGYRGRGGENTPPLKDAASLSLRGVGYEEALAASNVIILATPFPVTAELITSYRFDNHFMNVCTCSNCSHRTLLSGKIIIDMTNPFYSGNGLPRNCGFDSAIELHRSILDDSTSKWATGYKDIMWTKIVPGSHNVKMTTCGDAEAKHVITSIALAHGFSPLDRGGFEAASVLEPGRR